MKLFRHLDLTIAVFCCVAMVMAPMVAAAGTGQGTNTGTDQAQKGNLLINQGNDQATQNQGINPGQTTGQGLIPAGNVNQQGNSQNNAAPGQGNKAGGSGNATAFGNRTPPEKPDWDPDNSTAMNTTAWHGHRAGNIIGFNMTDVNMTDIPPPEDWDPANTTAMNHTAWHGDGNMTPLSQSPQQGNGDNQGQQGKQQQAQTQKNSDDSLIAELISWLKAHGIS